MRFSDRKLPRDSAAELLRVPLDEVRAWELLVAPAYVFLPKNEKFVAVKGPLDFFSDQELLKYRAFEQIFFPKFFDETTLFRDAGRATHRLLTWRASVDQGGKVLLHNLSNHAARAMLGPAPYEISDAVLQLMGPLWFDPMQIEPYFTMVFSNEVCGPFDPEFLLRAREKSVEQFERGVLYSGVVNFLALLSGQVSLAWLQSLRTWVISREVFGHWDDSTGEGLDPEFFALDLLARRIFRDGLQPIELDDFERRISNGGDRAALRILSRLRRIEEHFQTCGSLTPTVLGDRGLGIA